MSLNKNKYGVFFFIVLCTSVCAQRKEQRLDSVESEQLEEVIITATRTKRQLSSLPLPVKLVTKKEIERINSMRLGEVLNQQTGLITIPDFGGGEGIQMQGMDSEYTLILIDGMPLIGRSAGTLDVNRITVDNIQQIEIVKGASSGLYGSEALGGVINIITENPKNGFNGKLSSQYGTFNTNDTGVSLGYNNAKVSASIFVNRYSSDGYDLNEDDELNTVDPFVNYTFSSKMKYNFNDNTSLMVSGRYYTQTQDYIASEDLNGESAIDEYNSHLKLDHGFNAKWKGYFEFYTTNYNAKESLNNPDGTNYSDGYFDQRFLRPEARLSFTPNQKNNFIFGAGMNNETLDRTDFSAEPKFTSPYIYTQYDANPTEKLNLILGARFDSHSEYSSQFSPKAAFRYKFNNKIAVKASVGYGFKAPDFRQLYFDFTNSSVGYTVLGHNAVTTAIPRMEEDGQIENIVVPISEFENDLRPENSVAYNLGFDFKPISGIKLNVNLFRNNIEDLIDTRVIANKTNGQNVFSYYNVHKVYTQGLEFNTTWMPNNKLTLSGGYQLLYAKDKEAEDVFENGEVYARNENGSFRLDKEDYFGLYNRSRHMANLKLFYMLPEWKANMNIRGTYRSKYGLYDSNGNSYLDAYDDFVDGYSVWDIAVNKTFGKNYTVGVGANNIFGFTDGQITNISGRIIYGKLNIKF
ncbi:TonB-dependent receptor [Galbibacter sp. EGI 63066]|uniref:TonB-dependent receptor plug domain-containing protein n=1 Tax=Galbibacter sp. EGI 63066 TaxID=2993559 RepID=UPI002249104F|nr:TonB-dependent receptor [Galbibacter sp. EGI 63066]MCX2681861.1 TonB-dependent receptor [Galbibacter sp. EGI 63066]